MKRVMLVGGDAEVFCPWSTSSTASDTLKTVHCLPLHTHPFIWITGCCLVILWAQLLIFWHLHLLVVICKETKSLLLYSEQTNGTMEKFQYSSVQSVRKWLDFRPGSFTSNFTWGPAVLMLAFSSCFLWSASPYYERLVAISGFSTLQLMLRESEILCCLLNT